MTTADAFKEFRDWLLHQAKDNFRRDKGDVAHAYANAWLAYPDWAEGEATMQCCHPADGDKRMTWDDVYVDQLVHHKYFGWGIVDDYNDDTKYGDKMIFVRFFNHDGEDGEMKLPPREGPFGCMRYAEFGAVDCFDDWSGREDTEAKKTTTDKNINESISSESANKYSLEELFDMLEKVDTTADSTGVN